MKMPSRSKVLILFVASAGFLLYWQGKESSSGDNRLRSFIQKHFGNERGEPPPKDPRFTRILDPDFAVLPLSGYQSFLESSGRSPEAISLVYYSTYAPELLAELKAHPDNPTACFVLSQRAGTISERLLWALKLQKCDPENGFGSLLESKLLSDMGRPEEATQALDRALASAKFSGYFDKMVGEAKRTPLNIGKDHLMRLAFRDFPAARNNIIQDAIPNYARLIPSGQSPEKYKDNIHKLISAVDRIDQGEGFSGTKTIDEFSPKYSCTCSRQLIGSTAIRLNGPAALDDEKSFHYMNGSDNLYFLMSEGKKRSLLTPSEVDSALSDEFPTP